MAERFLPTEDPVLEQVLSWTVERDARDVRRDAQDRQAGSPGARGDARAAPCGEGTLPHGVSA